MKQNQSSTPKAVSMAVREFTSSADAGYSAMASAVQHAIDNNGSIIYNGNDEDSSVHVPFLASIAQVYPSFVRTSPDWDDEFFGWCDSARTVAIYFSHVAADQRETLLRQYLDATTVNYWLSHRSQFDDADCIAIRVEDNDGTWYEHIINHIN